MMRNTMTPAFENMATLPVGYCSEALTDTRILQDDEANRFQTLDAGNEDRGVCFPGATDENDGDTFWIAETGGSASIITNDKDSTTIAPGTMAAFVSRGTHWECLVSGLSWA